jgi:hypothetical protein
VPPSLNECGVAMAERICTLQQIIRMVRGCQSKGTNTPKTTPHGRRKEGVCRHARKLVVRVSWSYGGNLYRIITL